MKIYKLSYSMVFFISSVIEAAPLVQSIDNKTDIGFVIISHSDKSPCSLQDLGTIIEAHSLFQHEFLIESGEPSLVLRPVYYYDNLTNEKLWLVNDKNEFDEDKVTIAYQTWKKNGKKRKFSNAQDWLHHWVGLDIEVKPHTLEISGYLIHLSRIHASNTIKDTATWLSFSKGSRLVISLSLIQHDRKGIIPKLIAHVGEGGICNTGFVERL